MLTRTVNDAAKQFNRVIVMPNLIPPITDATQAINYKQRIELALQNNLSLSPLMLLYLTDKTTPKIVKQAKQTESVVGFKWYPAGATTNSDSGVTSLEKIYPALEAMQSENLVLAVHGEVTQADIDIFDREARFIDETLIKVANDFPSLRIVFEHITTREAVAYVNEASKNIAATITAHHLLFNRNHMLAGGIRPHYYCLPILKRSEHQQALINAATNGNNKFFLGTDSAPHSKLRKEAACGCAGAYTAYSAIELYAEAFDQANALNKLEAFAAHNGPDFYQLPRNNSQITLEKTQWKIPEHLEMAGEELLPLCAGETLRWKRV